jgi:Crp-like helix-turn-helix domain
LGNDLLIRQQISQYDLAAMVGGGREYVARTLSNWQDRKLVSRPPARLLVRLTMRQR